MKVTHDGLSKPFALFIALSAAGTAMAEGISRDSEEIWNPNQKQLESTIETGEIAYTHDYDSNAKRQTLDEAMKDDIGRLAKEAKISFQAAERAIKAQNQFFYYAEGLLAKYPSRIARVWNEPAPSTKSHIQFVGNVPDAVMQELKQNENPEGVSVTGGATFSFNEQIVRAQAAARGLRKSGYTNSATFYDPANNVIQLEIKISEYANQPDSDQVLSSIRGELRKSESREYMQNIQKQDLRIKTIRGDGPIMEFDHARGGNWLRDDGFRECTSGWSVSGPNGDGIITAAHCTGLNQFEEVSGFLFPMTWRDQEFGAGGDVEYHTTNHIELDDFYATATTIRDVSGIRWTLAMFGASVCEYGRSSNNRTCNHTVNGIFVTVNYPQGTVSNMVRVSGDSSIGGDSGGGWSWGNIAWGVHSGSNGFQSYFTPAQTAESSLNVTIKR